MDEKFTLPVHWFESKIQVTYFLRRMQHGVLLVSIFNDQRDPLDEQIVNFFVDIASLVRLREALKLAG